ncbi:hypothetical protein A2335_01460 [Candidatus Peregrinibacteria bacterium RIFOXYB2_FULL_32_7]|nr:MAG: hypothetical protein A2335_01460 [Candidatus Peregrinibacteria bacterium RIFOXYB2_FULL_32_7]
MNATTKDLYIACPNPDCEGKVEVPAETEVGEILVCDECGIDVEVMTVNNDDVSLEVFEDEEEDWEE